MAAAALDFSGRRVLVTGGGRGVGLGIVKKFLELNAHVVVLDKEEELLQSLKENFGERVTVGKVDLLDWNATKEAVKAVLPIHHLVNNAGVVKLLPLVTSKEEDYELIFGVNVKAVLNVSQVVIIDMIERGLTGATIVNISSIADTLPQGQGVGTHVGLYASSKAGVVMLTKCLAEEVIGHEIRVNYVSPATCAGGMDVKDPAFYDQLVRPTLRRMLGGRSNQTEDIGNAVAFLSSPLSSRITGTGLLVDAGYSVNLQAA